ncbi:SdpI family protein [Halomarina salina]|uniref:SdpI family protein n=1 Tax=Halomarina salina TaxID=1872699 RepID=A0ABD5RKX2_9EURY|nr:SdpI family protein [Halomarina salina]
MNTTRRFVLAAGLVALGGVASVLAAPSLPDQVVTHWNAAGEPDGTMAKLPALALMPLLSAFLVGLFAVIPRLDPLGENIGEFRPYYDWFVVVFAAFMLLVHLGTLAFNLGYDVDITQVVLAGVALLFYYVGVLLGHAERNWFVGVRTPWTLSSDEVWARTHRLAGRLFKLTALVSLVGLLVGDYAVYFLLVPALATAAVTVGYSYYLYERLERAGELSPNSGL